LEGSKKQGDVISDLETELNRLKKEEKRLLQDQQASSKLVEQLETEIAQLKVAGANIGDSKKSENHHIEMWRQLSDFQNRPPMMSMLSCLKVIWRPRISWNRLEIFTH
jgi:hypothetical protein